MKSTYAQKKEAFQCKTSRNIASVDDRRTVPVAQRVLQRDSGVIQRHPADGMFKFYPNISGRMYKNRIPYLPNKICFAPYMGGEILSAGFDGCYMMAFRFAEEKMKSDKDSHLIFDKNVPMSCNFSVTYIAHVANDSAREALFDAEDRGLVQIERIFKPYRSEGLDKPVFDSLSLSSDNQIANAFVGESLKNRAGLNRLTGGMEQTARGNWVSHVYGQEKFFDSRPNIEMSNYVWKNGPAIRSLDELTLTNESIATKICLYASVANKTNNLNIRNKATKKLNDWIGRYPTLAQYAKSSLFNSTDPAKELIQL